MWSYHLGDIWAATCFAIRQAEKTGRVGDLWASPRQVPAVEEVISLLDTTVRINIHSSPNTNYLRPIVWTEAFACQYVPTKIKWKNEKSKIICYQFDPGSRADSKKCDPRALCLLWRMADQLNYRMVDVGHHCPIPSAIHLLSIAEAFIGVPSGLSHIALSVGTPVHILLNHMSGDSLLGTAYKDKPVVMYRDAKALCERSDWIEGHASRIGQVLE